MSGPLGPVIGIATGIGETLFDVQAGATTAVNAAFRASGICMLYRTVLPNDIENWLDAMRPAMTHFAAGAHSVVWGLSAGIPYYADLLTFPHNMMVGIQTCDLRNAFSNMNCAKVEQAEMIPDALLQTIAPAVEAGPVEARRFSHIAYFTGYALRAFLQIVKPLCANPPRAIAPTDVALAAADIQSAVSHFDEAVSIIGDYAGFTVPQWVFDIVDEVVESELGGASPTSPSISVGPSVSLTGVATLAPGVVVGPQPPQPSNVLAAPALGALAWLLFK